MEPLPHSAANIGSRQRKKLTASADCRKSNRDANQIDNGKESVQHQECTDQPAPECPIAVEEELGPKHRTRPNAVKAVGDEVHAEIEQPPRPVPKAVLTEYQPQDGVPVDTASPY